MADAEELAIKIADVSRQIENVSGCDRLYINTAKGGNAAKETAPPKSCLEDLKKAIGFILQEHRAGLIVELAEASGMRKGDDRLALPEGETEGVDGEG